MNRIRPSHFPLWEKIGTPPHILDFIKNGLLLQWASVPPEPMEIKNLVEEDMAPYVSKRIALMESSGRIQRVGKREDLQFVSRFARSPLQTSGMLILNLRALNVFLAAPPKSNCSHPLAQGGFMREKLGANNWMAKLDLYGGYAHFAIREESQPFLGLQWDGVFYKHIALPHGLPWSTYMFGEVMEFLLRHVQQTISPNTVMFSDDWLIFGEDFSRVQESFSTLLDLFADLGLRVNFAKCSDVPVRSIQFLGYEVSTIGGVQLSPTAAKLTEVLDNVKLILELHEVAIRKVAGVNGQLASAVRYGAPRSLLDIESLKNVTRVPKDIWDESVAVTLPMRADLLSIADTLQALIDRS